MEKNRKKEKWTRLLNALSGKATSPSVPDVLDYPQKDPGEMAKELAKVPECVWGMYAFGREPLEGKFTREQKYEYIRKANA